MRSSLLQPRACQPVSKLHKTQAVEALYHWYGLTTHHILLLQGPVSRQQLTISAQLAPRPVPCKQHAVLVRSQPCSWQQQVHQQQLRHVQPLHQHPARSRLCCKAAAAPPVSCQTAVLAAAITRSAVSLIVQQAVHYYALDLVTSCQVESSLLICQEPARSLA